MQMTDKEFLESLAEIRLGHVPESMGRIAAYTNKTTREYIMFHEALVECVTRQKNIIRVMRELTRRMEQSVKRMRNDGAMEDEFDTEKALSMVYWLGGQAAEALRDGDMETHKKFIECASTLFDRIAQKPKEGENEDV